MTPADRQRLQQILATFDEAGLVALSNKGLVRRAQKDYEAGGLSWEETETGIIIRGPDATVTMPATGPVDARDDTRATGITRQILTATMFLRDNWRPDSAAAPAVTANGPVALPSGVTTQATASPQAEPAPPANPDLEPAIRTLIELTVDDLIKWAGKTTVSEGLAVARMRTPCQIEKAFGLTIRFPEHETEVRIIPKPWGRRIGALLDQFLSNAPKAFRQQWIVAAIAALRTEAGLADWTLDDVASKESLLDLRSRGQVLATSAELLQGLVRTGLAHPSQRMVQRLFTLSVSATGAHLPRLSRSLRAIADEVELILQRDAQGHSERLFDQMCLVHALVDALQRSGDRPAVELVGRHRTEYVPVGDLELSGVGAFPWRTASGYEGVTALLWDRQAARFWTWTESRPADGPGRLDVRNVYHVSSPWVGSPPLSEVCRRSFLLKGARANPQGRLSASQESSLELLPHHAWPPPDYDGVEFDEWSALAAYAVKMRPMGLRVPDPLQRIVVIHPHEWGPRVFDETQQRLVWTVLDSQGVPLSLVVSWEEANETAIEFLESTKVDRDRLTGVVGRVELRASDLYLEPLVLLSDGTPQGDRLLNPGFDRMRIEVKQASLLERLRAKFGRGQVATTIAVDDDQAMSFDDASIPHGVEARLADLEGRLLRLAETGLHQLDDLHKQQLTDLSRRLERSGLTELSTGARNLADGASPARLLWCRYLCRLHREAAVSCLP